MFRSVRKWFFSGLLLLSPVAVTIFVVNFLVQRLGVPTRNLVWGDVRLSQLHPWEIWALNIIALIIVLSIITLFGLLSSLVIGRYIVHTFERIVDTVPLVRSVYNTVKQIRDTFVAQDKAVFQCSVLLEYPRPGVWVLGFLTGSSKGEPQAITESDLLNIFVPTTPNPTSGFLLMVPREEVRFLQMSVADGMKLIISGGAVVPPFDPAAGETPAPETIPPPSTSAAAKTN